MNNDEETNEATALLDKHSSSSSGMTLKKNEILAKVDEKFSQRYQSGSLMLIFALNFVSSVLVNVDHGSLPGCSEKVKDKFHVDNFGFGLLGMVVYGGLVCGSAIGTKVFQNSERIKHFLATSLTI